MFGSNLKCKLTSENVNVNSFLLMRQARARKVEECDRVRAAENGHEIPYEISLALIKMPSRFCILSAGIFHCLLRPHHRLCVFHFIMSEHQQVVHVG